MSNTVNWSNPYACRDGAWLRGNLHTHTSPASGCGEVLLERVLELYDRAGYDFLSISDHMTLTPAQHARMTCIPGVEWNSPTGEHTGVYACDPALPAAQCCVSCQPALLDGLKDSDALVILNHPNWQLRPHYRREELLAAQYYDGIEIFNGVIRRLDGYEISTDKWDYLLAQGRRVLGFASDDSHCEGDIGAAAIVVRSVSRTAEDILAAIKAGNFYCTSGAIITDIRRDGNHIEIETDGGQEIQVTGVGGTLLHRVHDHSLRYEFAGQSGYVRFTVYGHGSEMAWTQAFFTE